MKENELYLNPLLGFIKKWNALLSISMKVDSQSIFLELMAIALKGVGVMENMIGTQEAELMLLEH